MAESPRPTREQVGDLAALAELRDTAREVAAEALFPLDIADGATEHDCAAVVVDALHDRGLLRRPADAEVRALRVELGLYDGLTERLHDALTRAGVDCDDDAWPGGNGLCGYVVDAALAARTPQPAEDEVEARFTYLATLHPGWDSYGAREIDPSMIATARSALAALATPAFICGTVEGGIQLAWGDEHVTLEINPGGLSASVGELYAEPEAAPKPADPRRTDVCTCSGTEDPPLPSEMDPACPLHGLTPQLAVPDGEDAALRTITAAEVETAIRDAMASLTHHTVRDRPARWAWAAWLAESAEQADDLDESERHGLRIAATHLLEDDIAARLSPGDFDPVADPAWALRFTARLWADVEAGRAARRASAPADGEDVPARLEAAADALEAAEPHSCAGGNLRSIAVALRLMAPEVCAAVAAALARPTGHQQ